jgi:hypothetical protein
MHQAAPPPPSRIAAAAMGQLGCLLPVSFCTLLSQCYRWGSLLGLVVCCVNNPKHNPHQFGPEIGDKDSASAPSEEWPLEVPEDWAKLPPGVPPSLPCLSLSLLLSPPGCFAHTFPCSGLLALIPNWTPCSQGLQALLGGKPKLGYQSHMSVDIHEGLIFIRMSKNRAGLATGKHVRIWVERFPILPRILMCVENNLTSYL